MRPAADPTPHQHMAAGSHGEVERLVRQIRLRGRPWRIVVRADSGLCRGEVMEWCEQG